MRTAVDHILPHDHAQTVAVVVPALGLDLDMLAKRVEAHFFHFYNIKLQGFIGGRRVEAVRPVSLVQHAVLEPGLSVQADTRDPVLIRLHGEAAQGKVTGNLIRTHGDRKVIQVRLVAGPGAYDRQPDRQWVIGKAGLFRDDFVRSRSRNRSGRFYAGILWSFGSLCAAGSCDVFRILI